MMTHLFPTAHPAATLLPTTDLPAPDQHRTDQAAPELHKDETDAADPTHVPVQHSSGTRRSATERRVVALRECLLSAQAQASAERHALLTLDVPEDQGAAEARLYALAAAQQHLTECDVALLLLRGGWTPAALDPERFDAQALELHQKDALLQEAQTQVRRLSHQVVRLQDDLDRQRRLVHSLRHDQDRILGGLYQRLGHLEGHGAPRRPGRETLAAGQRRIAEAVLTRLKLDPRGANRGSIEAGLPERDHHLLPLVLQNLLLDGRVAATHGHYHLAHQRPGPHTGSPVSDQGVPGQPLP